MLSCRGAATKRSPPPSPRARGKGARLARCGRLDIQTGGIYAIALRTRRGERPMPLRLPLRRADSGLAHDPESGHRFSEKIMFHVQARIVRPPFGSQDWWELSRA